VRRQVEVGIDCVGDGEFWTARSLAHYTAHFSGIEARPVAPDEPPTTRHSTRERDEFPDFYADMGSAGTLFLVPGEKPMPPVTVRVVARGPIKSKGPEAINRQLDTFKAAIERSGASVEEAFVPVLAPGWIDHFIFNEYYKTKEEFLFALADARRLSRHCAPSGSSRLFAHGREGPKERARPQMSPSFGRYRALVVQITHLLRRPNDTVRHRWKGELRRPMQHRTDSCCRLILSHLEHAADRLDRIPGAPLGHEGARKRCIDKYKAVFMEQNAHGLELWMQPLVPLRAPKLFNLCSDRFGRAEQEADDYDKWFIEHLFACLSWFLRRGSWLNTCNRSKSRRWS
jgi:hypothetical protein